MPSSGRLYGPASARGCCPVPAGMLCRKPSASLERWDDCPLLALMFWPWCWPSPRAAQGRNWDDKIVRTFLAICLAGYPGTPSPCSSWKWGAKQWLWRIPSCPGDYKVPIDGVQGERKKPVQVLGIPGHHPDPCLSFPMEMIPAAVLILLLASGSLYLGLTMINVRASSSNVKRRSRQ